MFKRHAASWLMAIGTLALAGCGGGDRVERFISNTEPANLRDPDMAAAVSLSVIEDLRPTPTTRSKSTDSTSITSKLTPAA